MYIFIYIYVLYVYIYIYIYTYNDIYIYICVCVCVCVRRSQIDTCPCGYGVVGFARRLTARVVKGDYNYY